MRWRISLAVVILGLSLAVACLVPSVDGLGNACDPTHPCVDGFVCTTSGLCVPPAADSGPGPSDANLCTSITLPACDGLKRTVCDQLLKPVKQLDDCTATGACDPRMGCLVPSDAGACPAGQVVDLATNLCVVSPVCDGGLDAGAGKACVGGALVTLPTLNAVVVIDDAGTTGAADFSCYGAAATDGGTATLSGFVTLATDTLSEKTIGAAIQIYTAATYNAGGAPLDTGLVTDAGVTVASVVKQMGFYSFSDVPVGPDLVVVTSGTGFVPTAHYFHFPTPTTRQQNVIAVEKTTLDLLADSSDQPLTANRAAVLGRYSDCHSPPKTVGNITAALDVVGRPFFSDPGRPGILITDSANTATISNGRFFFFDVPATRLNVVLAAGSAPTTTYLQIPIRTIPGGAVVVPVLPP